MAALAATSCFLRNTRVQRSTLKRAMSASRNATTVSASGTAYVPGGPIENATVVVTGGNRGIGLEFVKQILAKHPGNAVVAACRDPEGADELMDLQLEIGPDRLAVTSLDVSDENSIGHWASNLESVELVQGNGGSIDVVINNAGTTGTDGYSKWELEDMTSDEMIHVFKINTVGPMLVVQQLLKNKLIGVGGGDGKKGRPTLLGNVTSKVGSVEDNGSGKGYAYRASKAALNIINKSMSIDLLDRQVQSILLHPGWVRTRMTEGRGLVDADESAGGLIKAMESEYGEVNGRWYDYKGDEIPW
ncbi:SDR family oxidoreductase [bacterium]|nr:SDR family oxidoreductase [bacterium]|tara:strand:- start:2790 stop:3698 length:909 start_codon:yes stop_codon:yes gene_type:complete